MKCEVFIPKDAKQPFIDECRLYGANVTLVEGLITDAGRVATETAKPRGWYEVSTFREAGRCEGKKTMGYELAEQLGWTLPDWIIYPTGGGTGLVGMWKAFEEMEAIGWLAPGSARRWCRCRPKGARRSSAPSSAAPKPRAPGKTPTPWPTACACRAPSPTS